MSLNPFKKITTLETKFKLGFAIILLCVVGILLVELVASKLNDTLDTQYKLAKDIEYGVFSLDQLVGDYIVFESKSDSFYVSEIGVTQTKLSNNILLLDYAINKLSDASSDKLQNQGLFNELQATLKKLEKASNTLVSVLNTRGHRDFGLVGDMRKTIHPLEQLLPSSLMVQYLSIRRNEKDFLLRKDASYVDRLNQEVHDLVQKTSSLRNSAVIANKLYTYQNVFNEVVKLDYKVGTHNQRGLIHDVRKDLDTMLKLVDQIIEKTTNQQYQAQQYYARVKTVVFLILVCILLVFGYLFHYRFTQPMQKLSNSIRAIQNGKKDGLPNKAAYYELGNEVTEMALAMKDLLNKLEDQKDKLAYVAIDAQEASRVKTEFLSTMSHEIRTPLNAVVNIIADLAESESVQKHHNEDITILKASSEYLLSLINDVLDMNKINEGKLRLNPKPANIHETLKTASFVFKNRFTSKNITFIEEIAFDQIPEWLNFDSVRLNQILYNLLGNALKFTNHGSVRFIVKVTAHSEEDLCLYFEVQDSGIGIPKEKQSIIFDRFNQVDSSNNRNYGGSGLGLSIAQSLAQLMNSSIHLASEVHVGSRFWFEVKLTTSKAPELLAKPTNNNLQAKALTSAQSQKKPHVLIVDDNAVNVRIASKILEKASFITKSAANGKEAIELLEQDGTIDIVLMDLQMPVMDGFEASEKIRAMNAAFNNIPIIAVTASSLVDSRDQAYLVGMNDYVCKPFTPSELLEAIQKNISSTAVAV